MSTPSSAENGPRHAIRTEVVGAEDRKWFGKLCAIDAALSNRRSLATFLAPFPHRSPVSMLTSISTSSKRILSMKPEHDARRKIIREWMSLSKDKRQTEEQAKAFAKRSMELIPSSGDPYRQIMSWLLPRTGKT